MKKFILFLLIFVSEISVGQIKSVLIDLISKKPIPYVNIWVENENTGTTSNENGEFTLNTNGNNKAIIFSSIGYETLKISADQINNVVILKPKITELQEVVVKPEKEKKETVIGRFKKSGINFYFSCNSNPWISARFFKFNENFNQTPNLKKIRILTKSSINESKFNIRLYSVDENGKPDCYIYDKNIIGIARKGNRITEIDLSKLNIRFPEKGFFVAVEWLIIESNKYEINYTKKNSNEKLKYICYAPDLGTIPSEIDENSWFYIKGIWKKIWKNTGPIKQYENKYNLLAIELTLSN